ncbi:hypothetical protein BU52_16225 [Streptomyces toyocaensis]|uniref:Uncharacterized protein n=1 Tax=Streptomyces toyocaensis TaxID=55952 RepID=A0A081XRU8_STRTO|nr:hypothetical protein [Streptomyces toyocaensis]KES06271.1 hypothetical protein BU52_16225 [Streptomyces toyocaensis]
MNTTEPAAGSCLPWVGSAAFGAAAGAAAWALTTWARAYCDAGYEAGGRLELTFLLLLAPVAGALVGVMAQATGRRLSRHAPTAVRVALPTLLTVVATVWAAWWFFATQGTPAGYPGDSGLCPVSNIPPQWPAWIPA